MREIMRRLGTGERWWAAEVVVRAIGAGLLGLCALIALWLARTVQTTPHHATTIVEYGAACVAFLSWAIGGALAIEGPMLFQQVPIPGRHIVDIGDMK